MRFHRRVAQQLYSFSEQLSFSELQRLLALEKPHVIIRPCHPWLLANRASGTLVQLPLTGFPLTWKVRESQGKSWN